MAGFLSPAWITCLNESRSIWHSKWTCLAGSSVQESNTCLVMNTTQSAVERQGFCLILKLWMKKIVLGSGVPEFEEAGKTGGLVLYLMKSLHNSARYVVLNSRFCLLSALVALRKVGVFAGALIKKQQFWPRYIASDVWLVM